MQHFIDINELDSNTIRQLITAAKNCKQHRAGQPILAGKNLAMFFAKPSTRTRFSFAAAMHYLGGTVVITNSAETGYNKRETTADIAKILGLYNDIIVARVFAHAELLTFAQHAGVPVINGLSDSSHPCQVLADLVTVTERFGDLAPLTMTWLGDINNVCISYLQFAVKLGFKLKVSCPKHLRPKQGWGSLAAIKPAQAEALEDIWIEDPHQAASGADVIITDTWISMGHEQDNQNRSNELQSWQVNKSIMRQAKPSAVFLHCLPAKRGQEVTADVIDGKQSLVWQEAENRKYAQIAVLAWCLGQLGQLQ